MEKIHIRGFLQAFQMPLDPFEQETQRSSQEKFEKQIHIARSS